MNNPASKPAKSLTAALWVNAAFLAIIALALLARSTPSLLPLASAQNQPPIAGGAGVFIMPAQLGPNNWGVYLLDVDAQTLATYTYNPSPRQLQLVAARTYRYDRRLQNFNTAAPSPEEVRQLVDRELQMRPGSGGGATGAATGGLPSTQPSNNLQP